MPSILGVLVNFSVVHNHGRLVRTANTDRFLERIKWLKQQKQEGKGISTPYYLIDYYERALADKPMDWTCQGGNKCYYVSSEGNFQFCYHVPSKRKLLDVTREEMAGYRGKKGCETNCGVDCVIHTSLPFSQCVLSGWGYYVDRTTTSGEQFKWSGRTYHAPFAVRRD